MMNATKKGLLALVPNGVKRTAQKAGTALTLAAIGTQQALATPAAGYDESAITDAITGNLGKGVIVLGVFIVAVWTLRSMGLLGGRK